MEELEIGSDNTITLHTLVDDNGGRVNNADVSAVLYDRDYTPVPGPKWPLTLVAVGDGSYKASLSHAADLKPGKRYWLRVTARHKLVRTQFEVRASAARNIQS